MRLSVPISLKTLTQEQFPAVLKSLQACKASRAFICGLGNIYDPRALTKPVLRQIRWAVQSLKENGLEVGIWFSTLGHGQTLVGDYADSLKERYTSLTGIHGDQPEHSICPLDPNFLEDFAQGVKKLAQQKPDILMTDDDLRITRGTYYYFGCFCHRHLEILYKELGERIPREELENKIFVGGANKYRDAYQKVLAQSLTGFVTHMRKTIDSVDENIRFAVCSTAEHWDLVGLEVQDYARVYAGKTKPLLRTSGAPYWPRGIVYAIECTRAECAMLRDSGIELMAEGDVYPRPRYHVPSRKLELYTYALIADGNCEGLLGYIFDYHQKPDYETGYIDRYVKTEPLREGVGQLFAGKQAVGIYAHIPMHKVKNWVLPDEPLPGIATRLSSAHRAPADDTLCDSSIPCTYTPGEYPCLLTGENARSAEPSLLKNGTILDATAAMILSQRGIDTGICTSEPASFQQEHYIAQNDTIPNVDCGGLRKITCKETVTVLSRFEDGSVASYTYENAEGQRFYVIAFDHFFTEHVAAQRKNFLNNYYRQADMTRLVPWLCGKPLPATCPKNPGLYMYTARKDNALSVLLLNVHEDGIDEPVITLDGAYTAIRSVNCTARLEGDRVYLSELHPWSMAAFEVC